MAQVKIIRDELIQVRSILNDFSYLRQKHSLNWMALNSLLISVRSSMTSLQNVTKAWSEKLIRFEENSEFKSKLALCENAVDVLEQYGRGNCLLFHGIKEATGEDCDEEVINLCRERLHIEITPL